MTDIGRQIVSSDITQLPPAAYFDQELFELEMQTIFRKMPQYVGHALCAPEPGNYHTLKQEGEGRVLVHTAEGVELLSNVCRHRQAIMLRDQGNLPNGNLTCPLHRWNYNVAGGAVPAGALTGAPHFDTDPCLHLQRYPLQNWNGMLFDAGSSGADVNAQLAAVDMTAHLSFEGYVYNHTELHMCDYNWKTFIEVYLEDYHVGPFHPGLGQFVTCDDLEWQFGDWHSVQTVGVHAELKKPGSEIYRPWHDAVLQSGDGNPPDKGAVWLTYYPTLMLEWYPGTLVVSNLYPLEPQKTLNVVEFFYTEEIAAFEPDFMAAQQAAYMETCDEDDDIAVRMDEGRKALFQRGDVQTGPYQLPMEAGMEHFHIWYRKMLGSTL